MSCFFLLQTLLKERLWFSNFTLLWFEDFNDFSCPNGHMLGPPLVPCWAFLNIILPLQPGHWRWGHGDNVTAIRWQWWGDQHIPDTGPWWSSAQRIPSEISIGVETHNTHHHNDSRLRISSALPLTLATMPPLWHQTWIMNNNSRHCAELNREEANKIPSNGCLLGWSGLVLLNA